MAKQFSFSGGDRVDFISDGIVNGTPGTVLSRTHSQEEPSYRVTWDDGNKDNEFYADFELIPAGSVYVVCNRRLNAETNQYCEFDGYVVLADGKWTCPGCRATRAA